MGMAPWESARLLRRAGSRERGAHRACGLQRRQRPLRAWGEDKPKERSMTTKTTRRQVPSDKPAGGDAETRALAANPRFWELIEEGRRSGPGLTVEESNARAGITDEE